MDAIAVIDFGSQYAHLIANRVRRLGVYAEILLPETLFKKLTQYKGLILSGGPQSVYDAAAPTIDRRIFSLGMPILGICYGHQLIHHLLGGKVIPGITKEYGFAKLSIQRKMGILKGVHNHTQVWMSHGDTVTALPPGFMVLAKTEDCQIAATANPEKKIFSTQFHIEVTHTPEGMKILENFLNVCRIKRQWSIDYFLQKKISEIKKQLGNRKVFLLVSGGVDSTVAYVLLSRALGINRVYGLFIDTGFLRRDEVEKIQAVFKKIGVSNFHVFHAKQIFFKALQNVIHPEEKRKIIGDVFLQVQAQAVRNLKLNPDHWVLGQGTIYPDTIESAATKYADKIKTHHNRVKKILELIKKGKIIEPLAELYKDEVRQLGQKLGLPADIVWKHPFPGPGLAVRILCAKKPYWPKNLNANIKQIDKYLKPFDLSSKILPLKSVGIQGDNRTYRNPLILFGREKKWNELEKISTALTNRFSMINRVCLLLFPENLESVSVIAETLSLKRIQLLQELDDMVMKFLQQQRIMHEIWQCPTVLLPLSINGKKKDAIVLRPVCSEEAMTANFYKMDRKLLKKLTAKLAHKVSAVFYDITNKPPGTIEWE